MNRNARTFVTGTGHRGMVGSDIVRRLQPGGCYSRRSVVAFPGLQLHPSARLAAGLTLVKEDVLLTGTADVAPSPSAQ